MCCGWGWGLHLMLVDSHNFRVYTVLAKTRTPLIDCKYLNVLLVGLLRLKPSHGLLSEKHQLFVLQMLPREAKLYKHIMSCFLNASALHTQVCTSGLIEHRPARHDQKCTLYCTCECTCTAVDPLLVGAAIVWKGGCSWYIST